jgi:hypothetical protein
LKRPASSPNTSASPSAANSAPVDSTTKATSKGLPDFTIEVKNYANVTTGVAAGLADSTREQANAGTTHGAAMIRRPGGRWFVALTVDQFATLVREAM